ncbi:MAG: peptide synthetase, partial [Actinomycetales bacterium]
MRLTNVAHLRLPFGRLLGYDLTVGPRQDSVPVSFDQRRHVARGSRPGSWMAITVRLPTVDLDELADAWLAVVARHGTLRTVFSPGRDGPLLHDHAMSAGSWVEHRVETGESVNEALRSVLDAFCGSTARPSHRLCVLLSDDRPTLVIAADHAHVDMW